MTIRIRKPRITIRKPRVTVGGDVGRAGDRIIRSTTQVIEDFVKAPLTTLSQIPLVVDGKPVDQALKDSLKAYLEPVASAADVVAFVNASAKELVGKLAGSIGGETAEHFVSDVIRLAQPFPPEYAAALLGSIKNFIDTGRLDSLDPISTLFAAELTHARNLLWDKGQAIAPVVVSSLPEAVRSRAGTSRAIMLSQVPGKLNIPNFAINHFDRASAICLIDLIVFKKTPGHSTDNELFFWTHELHHAQQFADWGTLGFVQRYLRHELKPSSKVNPIEEDADLNACRFFPRAQPHYIGSCPV